MIKYTIDGKIEFSNKLEKNVVMKMLAQAGYIHNSDGKWVEFDNKKKPTSVYFGVKQWVEFDDLEYAESQRRQYHYHRAGYIRTMTIIDAVNSELEHRLTSW